MNLPEDDIRLFNDSLDRCVADPRFMDVFYDRFIGGSPEVAAKFAATDMDKQKRLLKASLYTAMLTADGNGPALVHLELLGRHHRALGIGAELYDYWRDCLLATVKECGGLIDVRAADVWRRVLAVAIGIMKPDAE